MREEDEQKDAIYKALLLAINQYYGLSLKFMSRTVHSDFDVFGDVFNGTGDTEPGGGVGTCADLTNCIADCAIADNAIAC